MPRNPHHGDRDAQRRIDEGLRELCAKTPPGVALQQKEIAAACGLTRQGVAYIERRALLKLRNLARTRRLLTT
jgi:hypothetical protein